MADEKEKREEKREEKKEERKEKREERREEYQEEIVTSGEIMDQQILEPAEKKRIYDEEHY